MAKKVPFVVTGDKRLNKMLGELAAKEAKKIVRAAARKAVVPVRNAAKRNAPHDTGALEKAIKVRAMKRSRSRFGVRVTIGAGEFQGETFYGGFQEWGWKTPLRHIEGQRFLTRAADEKRRAALTIYRTEIARGLAIFSLTKGRGR